MQPVLALIAHKYNQAILSIVFIDLIKGIALKAIRYPAIAAKAVGIAIGSCVYVFLIYTHSCGLNEPSLAITYHSGSHWLALDFSVQP